MPQFMISRLHGGDTSLWEQYPKIADSFLACNHISEAADSKPCARKGNAMVIRRRHQPLCFHSRQQPSLLPEVLTSRCGPWLLTPRLHLHRIRTTSAPTMAASHGMTAGALKSLPTRKHSNTHSAVKLFPRRRFPVIRV
jgi:hypothetical protein